MSIPDNFYRSSFGELLVANPKPMIQLVAAYGIRSKTDTNIYVDSANSGSVSVQSNSDGTKEFKVSSGSGANSFALMRSIRTVRYRAAQGIRFKFTGRFTSGVTGNTQRIGLYNHGNELAFGYNGTQFGILFRHGGLPEIRTLTISAGAGGAETATVTLNGVTKNVSLTAGNTVHAAVQIASQTYHGWEVSSSDSQVIFVAKNDTVFSGAFTLTSTGTAAGTFARTSAGITSTSTWIPQDEWNIDHCDGIGPSGFLLDHTKGNIFTIMMQYLGYGPITFSIENDAAENINVHKINYPNNNTVPTISLPIFKFGIGSYNTTNTTSITCYSASAAGFMDGEYSHQRNPDSATNSKTGVGTTLTPILSIRCGSVFNSTWNLNSVLVHSASCAVDGTKPAVVRIILNGSLSGDPNWVYQDQTNSTVEYDTAATGITVGSSSQVVASITLGKSEGRYIDLASLDVILNANDVLTLAVQATSATTDASCSFTWHED